MYPRPRGVHDIKTHGSQARKGILISVAKNLGGMERREPEGYKFDNNWSAEQHVFSPKKSDESRRLDLAQELSLRTKVRAHQIKSIQFFLEEFQKALDEGIPVSEQKFERLKKRLAELKVEEN